MTDGPSNPNLASRFDEPTFALGKYLMPERTTPYLQTKIAGGSSAIEAQYIPRSSELETIQAAYAGDDPLGELERYSPIKGLVHKYKNRALLKVSYRCAAHCRMCTRYKKIGSLEGDLTDADIAAIGRYVVAHSEIDDVLLSGGDPFFTPKATIRVLRAVAPIPSVKVLRFGTRLPLQSPASINSVGFLPLLREITAIAEDRPTFIQIQVNHPDEINRETVSALKTLRRAGATLLSQTVFWRGLNDDVEVLERLFRSLYHNGVIPYYIYHGDAVAGLESFVCDFAKERTIMTELTRRMSGIGVPKFVIDVSGKGKVPVPLEFWELRDPTTCADFDGKAISI